MGSSPSRAPPCAAISPDLDDHRSSRRVNCWRGGKRFRALFCYWGWRSVAGLGDDSWATDAIGETRARGPRPGGLGRGRARDLSRGRPRARRHHGQLRPAPRQAEPAPAVRGAAPRRRLGRDRRRQYGDAAALLARRPAARLERRALRGGRGAGARPGCRQRRPRRVLAHAHRGDGRAVPRHARGDVVAHPPGGRAARPCPPRHRLQVGQVQRRGPARASAPRWPGGSLRPARRPARLRTAARRGVPAARRPARRVRRSRR